MQTPLPHPIINTITTLQPLITRGARTTQCTYCLQLRLPDHLPFVEHRDQLHLRARQVAVPFVCDVCVYQ